MSEISHHGVKGMKWGVTRKQSYASRTQATADRLKRVGAGTPQKGDVFKTFMGVGTHGFGGVLGIKTAAIRGQKLQAHIDRLKSGQASTRDTMRKYGGMSLRELTGGVRDK